MTAAFNINLSIDAEVTRATDTAENQTETTEED